MGYTTGIQKMVIMITKYTMYVVTMVSSILFVGFEAHRITIAQTSNVDIEQIKIGLPMLCVAVGTLIGACMIIIKDRMGIEKRLDAQDAVMKEHSTKVQDTMTLMISVNQNIKILTDQAIETNKWIAVQKDRNDRKA